MISKHTHGLKEQVASIFHGGKLRPRKVKTCHGLDRESGAEPSRMLSFPPGLGQLKLPGATRVRLDS